MLACSGGAATKLASPSLKPRRLPRAQDIELSKRVAQLEGEIIALQRLIKQLKREKAHESQIEAA